MAQKIELGQKFILNQYVQSIGNKGIVITFGEDYKDKKMLQYFLRSGEISPYTDTVKPRSKTKHEEPSDTVVD